MALKPTIYKLQIVVSDMNADFYDSLSLTVAQHPSETLERMMARILASCLNAQQRPVFTRGLSAVDEPDLWTRTLDDQIALWVDVGEPAADRIKKSCRQSAAVKVYSFNAKSDVWWQQLQDKVKGFNVSVYRFDWAALQDLSITIQRTMDMSVTISGQSIYVSSDQGENEIAWQILQEV